MVVGGVVFPLVIPGHLSTFINYVINLVCKTSSVSSFP